MSGAERTASATARANRRAVIGGTWIVVFALLSVFVIAPQFRQWRAREARISAARVRLQDLADVVRNQSTLEAMVQRNEGELSLRPQRVLQARSRALAASALQSLVQEMAEASNVTVTRLDVANLESSADLPITLSANGDIFGLSELLRQIRVARYTIVIDKLQTQNNSALRGAPDVLQIGLSLHAPVIVQ